MLITLLASLAALLTSLIVTPLVRKLAIRFAIFASPNHRTVHQDSMPKLGGLSIYGAFTIGLIIFGSITKQTENLWGLLIGGSVVLFVGLYDDFVRLGCYRKLIGQSVAASIAVYFGFMTDSILLPLGGTIELGYLAPLVSILWIVLITNAMNLLDGLDGLAASVSIVISLFISLTAGLFQNVEVAAFSAILIMAVFGFLKYNKPPAKIFMGDSGSLFLGFSLGCLSLKAFSVSANGTNFLLLFVIFALPLADTGLAVLRRLSQNKHPFSPDKKHIHHHLLEVGFSQPTVTVILSLVALCFGLVGILLTRANLLQAFFLLLCCGILFILFLLRIGCFDFLSSEYASKKRRGISLDHNDKIDTEYSGPILTPPNTQPEGAKAFR